jgi:hypothetical protein
MSKKSKRPTSKAPEANDNRPLQVNWRIYWLRAGIVTVLVFALIMFLLYPTRGTIAILWASLLAAAILGYFVVTYYFLNR